MGLRYSSNQDSGWNASPPADVPGDTSQANKVEWSKHRDKLSKPIRDNVNNINSDLLAFVDWDTLDRSADYTTLVSDSNRLIDVTGTTTITLGNAPSMGLDYRVIIKCLSGQTTVSTINTIDGSPASRLLNPGDSESYFVSAPGTGYISIRNLASITTDDKMNLVIGASIVATFATITTFTVAPTDRTAFWLDQRLDITDATALVGTVTGIVFGTDPEVDPTTITIVEASATDLSLSLTAVQAITPPVDNLAVFDNQGQVKDGGTPFDYNTQAQQDGWIDLPGGITMQWGFWTVNGSGGTTTVTYPKAFSAGPYSVVATTHDPGNTGGSGNAAVTTITTDPASFVVSKTNNDELHWQAIGPT